MLPIRTILHPTDLSDSSKMAFSIARSLEGNSPARLVILYVDTPRTPLEGEAELFRKDAVEQELIEQLRARQLVNAKTSVEYRVVKGNPVEEILDTAENIGADVIVMGTHGRSGVRRLMMGSVAEAVSRKATCPVVTVGGKPKPTPETAHEPIGGRHGDVAFAEAGPEDWHEASSSEDPFREVDIPVGPVTLRGTLQWSGKLHGVVVFAHGSGSSRHSPRNRYVASVLTNAGFATLLLDLLTEEESENRKNVFDTSLLAERLTGAAEWVARQPETAGLPVGFFGASTGSAAALIAAARCPEAISVVVSRGGRPDLAWDDLPAVQAPTMLIVGGDDEPVLSWNRDALKRLSCEKKLVVIPGATHLFEEHGALEKVAELARDWFVQHSTVGTVAK